MLNRFFGGSNALKKSDKWLFGTMLAFAIAAFLASFVLSVEKLEIIKNPDAKLSCSVNIILNCASVMKTPQAEVLGFPNSFIGVASFAIVIAVAMGGLFGVKYTRPYLVTAQFFYGLGLLFAYWLFFQSVYVIQVLCPWCLVVTFATTIIFEALLRLNLRANNFGLAKASNKRVQTWLDKDYDKLLVGAWLLLMTVLVFLKFGEGLFA
jgi:uncharacterized membrane protein